MSRIFALTIMVEIDEESDSTATDLAAIPTLLPEFEEIVAKKGLSLYDSNIEEI